jgi:hypothetical protein
VRRLSDIFNVVSVLVITRGGVAVSNSILKHVLHTRNVRGVPLKHGMIKLRRVAKHVNQITFVQEPVAWLNGAPKNSLVVLKSEFTRGIVCLMAEKVIASVIPCDSHCDRF